jgi:hypothetical protein
MDLPPKESPTDDFSVLETAHGLPRLPSTSQKAANNSPSSSGDKTPVLPAEPQTNIVSINTKGPSTIQRLLNKLLHSRELSTICQVELRDIKQD